MRHISLALGWFLGVLFLMSGLALLYKSSLAGLSSIAMSLLLLPPVGRFVASKTNKDLPGFLQATLLLALFASCLFFVQKGANRCDQALEMQQENIRAGREAEIQHDLIYFSTNRDQILEYLRDDLAAGRAQSVISRSNKYIASNDEALLEIHQKAIHMLMDMELSANTDNLPAE